MISRPPTSNLLPLANLAAFSSGVEGIGNPFVSPAASGGHTVDAHGRPVRACPVAPPAHATDPTDTAALFEILEDGGPGAEHARAAIVARHESLVEGIARHYRKSGLPMSDLRQEGRLGLLRATQKFERRRGYRFSTYAAWWVRARISRFVRDMSRTVKLPSYAIDEGRQLMELQKQIEAETGAIPDVKKLAELSGLSVKLVKRRLAAYNGETKSLDEQPFGNSGRAETWLDRRIDRGPSPDELAHVKTAVERLIGHLTPPHRRTIELSFGLDPSRPARAITAKEGALTMGVSENYFKILKQQAMARLVKLASMRSRPGKDPASVRGNIAAKAMEAELGGNDLRLYHLTYVKWVSDGKAAEMLGRTREEVAADRKRLAKSLDERYAMHIGIPRSTPRDDNAKHRHSATPYRGAGQA